MARAETEPKETFEQFALSISQEKDNLATEIRNCAKAQACLWQQIPNLALEADGRSGYNDMYALAYRMRVWPIHSQNGRYDAYIDLQSGEIVHFPNWTGPIYVNGEEVNLETKNSRKPEPLPDKNIITFADNLDWLNAQKLIDELNKCAQEPYFKGYNPQEQEAWRTGLRKELDLDPN
jgi:hypothetical protein